MSSPRRRTLPASGRRRPSSIDSGVVLPAPLPPSSAAVPPAATAKAIAATAPRCSLGGVMPRFFEYPNPLLPEGEGGAAGVNLRRLITTRRAAVIGRAAALLVTQNGLAFALRIVSALPVVAASALINVGH